MNQLVSVIVPVYNGEEHIQKCIDSIINQTYQNIELILLDDHSNDNTLRICQEYVKRDSRIKLIKNTEPSKGPGISRKEACKHGSGAYICFADADDFMEAHMIETLLKRGLETDADIICCGFYQEYTSGQVKKHFGNDEVFNVSQGKTKKEDLIEKLFIDKGIASYFWNKMFRRNVIVDHLDCFSERSCFEDIDTLYKLACHSLVIACIKEPLYHYVRHEQKGFMENWREQESKDYMDVHLEAAKYLVSYDINLRDIMQYICVITALRDYKALSKCKKNSAIKERMTYDRQYVKKYYSKIKASVYVHKGEGIQLKMLVFLPLILKLCVKFKQLFYY